MGLLDQLVRVAVLGHLNQHRLAPANSDGTLRVTDQPALRPLRLPHNLSRVSVVTSKGQVTIPSSIRRILKVEAGDRLDFVVEREGRVVVRAGGGDIRDLKGLLHRPGRRSVTIEQMNAAIARQGRRRA